MIPLDKIETLHFHFNKACKHQNSHRDYLGWDAPTYQVTCSFDLVFTWCHMTKLKGYISFSTRAISIKLHCVKSFQIRSYFWSVFSCITQCLIQWWLKLTGSFLLSHISLWSCWRGVTWQINAISSFVLICIHLLIKNVSALPQNLWPPNYQGSRIKVGGFLPPIIIPLAYKITWQLKN